jgi:dolichol-phosphate mannosyltransferase
MFLPAWNEADNLPHVVADAVAYLRSRDEPFTVIIVDDGSTDHTPEVIRQLDMAYPDCIHYVRHSRNLGYGAALRTGFRAGLETDREWIGFCDADGQFKPQDIGRLIDKAIEYDSDIAIGYRLERADSLKRRLMGKGWHYLSRLILGYKAVDVDCGMKVFRRHVIESLMRQLRTEYATISPELLARAHRARYRMVEAGVAHYPRVHGTQSGASLGVVWASLVGLVGLRLRMNQKTLLDEEVV